jgi:hypothetical protein
MLFSDQALSRRLEAAEGTHADNLRWPSAGFFLRAAPRPFALQVPTLSSMDPRLQ